MIPLAMYREAHVERIEERAGAPQILALLSAWRALAAEGALPAYADFNPQAFPEFLHNMAVVEALPDGDYRYIHYGAAITEATGIDMLGSRVSEWNSEAGRFFGEIYDRVSAERRPIYALHRAAHAVRVHLWERLVLPLKAVDGSLRLLGYNAAREFKDDLLGAVLEAAPQGIVGLRAVRDAGGGLVDAIVVTANQRAAEILGWSVDELLDRALLALFPGLKGSPTWRRYVDVVERRRPQQFELHYSRGREVSWFNVNAIPLGDGFMVSLSDITGLKNAYRQLEARHAELAHANAMLERQTASLEQEMRRREALEEELRRIADVDMLTSVATRRAFVAQARRAIAEASRSHPLAVIGLDIDRFKAINDRYGHLNGDRVLAAVGAELKAECRASDICGRLGGEEFAVVLPDTTLEEATRVAERIRARLIRLVLPAAEGTIAVTASFGVAAHEPGDSYDRLFARADEGLYRAKRAGRDRIVAVQRRPIDGPPRLVHG